MHDEPIAAYLTRWSGISPGDLDPAVSPHHVTTLKVALRPPSPLLLGNGAHDYTAVSSCRQHTSSCDSWWTKVACLLGMVWTKTLASSVRSIMEELASPLILVPERFSFLPPLQDILVPREQVRDTVKLYHLDRQRYPCQTSPPFTLSFHYQTSV